MKRIANDDLTVGMIVVGLGKPAETRDVLTGGMFGSSIETMTVKDRSYAGKVYRIVAIDLPFLAMIEVHDGFHRNRGGSARPHDLREGYLWAKPSDEFLRSLGLGDLVVSEQEAGQ